MDIEDIDGHSAIHLDPRVLSAAPFSTGDGQIDVPLTSDGKSRQRRVAVLAFLKEYVHPHGAILIFELSFKILDQVKMT